MQGNGFYFPESRCYLDLPAASATLFNSKRLHCITEPWYAEAPPTGAARRFKAVLSMFIKDKHVSMARCVSAP